MPVARSDFAVALGNQPKQITAPEPRVGRVGVCAVIPIEDARHQAFWQYL